MCIVRVVIPCQYLPNLFRSSGFQCLTSRSYKTAFHSRVLSTAAVKGEIYDKKPVKVEVKAGKVYSWCACGRSKNQPFCDGSHRYDKSTGEKLAKPPIQPIKYKANEDKTVFFCNCKQTSKLPLCDGTHKKL